MAAPSAAGAPQAEVRRGPHPHPKLGIEVSQASRCICVWGPASRFLGAGRSCLTDSKERPTSRASFSVPPFLSEGHVKAVSSVGIVVIVIVVVNRKNHIFIVSLQVFSNFGAFS